MDATQAFDRVWHGSMLVKLYDVGLSGRKWLFLNNWYEDLTLQVKWKGEVSSSFNETLCVRQGGTWSPMGYNFFINPLFNTVKDHGIGFHIGIQFCGVIGVADDLLYISACRRERQVQASIMRNTPKRSNIL